MFRFAAMRRGITAFMCLLVWVGCALAQTPLPGSPRVSYTLLEDSSFEDDCLLCGRPTILQPLRGMFDLVLVQDTPPYTRYAIQNLDFTAEPPWLERHITGDGTYVRFEEFALVQDMTLAVIVRDQNTNEPAYFTNQSPIATQPFPLI